MNISEDTFAKFRIYDLTVKEYKNWVILTRMDQVTLGSLVLMNTNGATDFGTLSSEEILEMGKAISDIETKLKQAFNYDKINYQMLRMVDSEVHFHIIPRYKDAKNFNDKIFLDQNWPGPFSLKNENKLTDEQLYELHHYLKELFNK